MRSAADLCVAIFQLPCATWPCILTAALAARLCCNALARRAAWRQRIATILIYLNDVPSGGETHFPKLKVRGAGKEAGLRVRPASGRALIFFPADLSAVVDHRLVAAPLFHLLPCYSFNLPRFLCMLQIFVQPGSPPLTSGRAELLLMRACVGRCTNRWRSSGVARSTLPLYGCVSILPIVRRAEAKSLAFQARS